MPHNFLFKISVGLSIYQNNYYDYSRADGMRLTYGYGKWSTDVTGLCEAIALSQGKQLGGITAVNTFTIYKLKRDLLD